MKATKIVVDIDGTLCPVKKKDESYMDLIPHHKVVDKLREYHEAGCEILLYTARNMRTHEANLGKINKFTAPILFAWLDKWDIPYDEILFGKPWPKSHGFYIDDKAIRPSEFITNSDEQIQQLIEDEAKRIETLERETN